MIYIVKPPTHPIRATINLPASKSISNRVLIIRALSGCNFQIKNLSDCDDTNVMLSGLELPDIIDVGAAGTTMRFMTAYLSQLEGQIHTITGSERMKQRPIKVLVDALRTLGADIEYLGEIGCPPLRIHGKKLACTDVLDMDGSVSSQYISAILMIGPMLSTGLKLRLDGEVASRPYIEMTLALMFVSQLIRSLSVNRFRYSLTTSFRPFHRGSVWQADERGQILAPSSRQATGTRVPSIAVSTS